MALGGNGDSVGSIQPHMDISPISPISSRPRRSSLRLSWASFTNKLNHTNSATPISATSPPPSAWSPRDSLPYTFSPSGAPLTRYDSYDQGFLTTTNGFSRTPSSDQVKSSSSSIKGSFSRNTFTTMMGSLSNFSSISLGGKGDKDKSDANGSDTRAHRRGRSSSTNRPSTGNSLDSRPSHSRSRTRSVSPFFFRRRRRDPSPHVEALPISDAESDTDSLASKRVPRNTAFSIQDDSASEGDAASETTSFSEDDGDSASDIEDFFDHLTERNTSMNSQTAPPPHEAVFLEEPDIDPLGEGVNVVVPAEPLFPSTLHGLNTPRRGASVSTRRKVTVRVEHLPLSTSRPMFQRDRCTIRLTNGDPIATLRESGRKPKRYVVASDLSVESKYAVEWCIGTVMRDGDEMIVITVAEGDSKDVVDFIAPTMLIVGSRGLNKIKGILLGSTSHYLIQKSSVPVMVARRRLKRPPKRAAHLSQSSHRPRVPLSEAAIDKAPSKVENDVLAMRDEIEREEREERDRRGGLHGDGRVGGLGVDVDVEREEDEVDPEAEGVAEGGRVPTSP
ncbi:hypothetical protein Clacol_007450 [Clathrus columnatus]|uniref:UspA domain-containing protein n=1 Tax=Clathrus columnatus TaxID=1419009 RepID=A0AAV5AEY9_9AGAM|nr:hypothetical protein Clacol_007450 [Clathrus columnatus]